MYKKYNCKPCNYASDRLSDYNKHLETKKHKKLNSESVFETNALQGGCIFIRFSWTSPDELS